MTADKSTPVATADRAVPPASPTYRGSGTHRWCRNLQRAPPRATMPLRARRTPCHEVLDHLHDYPAACPSKHPMNSWSRRDLLEPSYSRQTTFTPEPWAMLLWMSSHRCDGCVVGQDGLVEGAGEVAFQAADDLLLGHAFLGAPVHVGAGFGVVPEPAQHDPVQGRVRVPVAAAGQPVPAVGLP